MSIKFLVYAVNPHGAKTLLCETSSAVSAETYPDGRVFPGQARVVYGTDGQMSAAQLDDLAEQEARLA